MPRPQGFHYQARADGTVRITHNGRPATTLRGPRAGEFLMTVESGDPQLVMARWTATTSAATNARPAITPATAADPMGCQVRER